MTPHIVGVIFARGGSKGVPRKNLRALAGRPLIAYAIATAQSVSLIDRVVVSTDDPEIAAVARTYGADVPFIRPAELAQDDSPEWLAWRHAIRALTSGTDARPMDLFVCIPTTSPLRAVDDVTACIETLLTSDADMVITVKAAARNPYFNMVCLDPNGYAHIVIPPTHVVERRQAAPVVYDMTTVAYVTRPAFVFASRSVFEGKVRAVVVPDERALDIDTEQDFHYAEFLLQQRERQKGEMAGKG